MSWYSSTLNQRFRARTVAARLGVALEEVDGADEQVVEVDPPGARLRALVAGERAHEQVDRDGRLARRDGEIAGGRGLVRRGREPAALGPFDLVGDVLGRRESIVPGQRADERHEQRQLRIEQVGQRLAVVRVRPEMAELAERVGVEGPGGHPGRARGP